MESEKELNKDEAHDTDGGFSEKKLAKQVDLGVSSKSAQLGINIFAAQKKGQTLFQAHKEEEI